MYNNFDDNVELQKLIEQWISSNNQKLICNIAKLSSAQYAFDLCKKRYMLTKDRYYIRCMRKINLIYRIKADIFSRQEKAKNRKKAEKVEEIIKQTAQKILDYTRGDKYVFIFQHAFFDTKGEKCFSGGAERYVCDLGEIFKQKGYKTFLIQMGDDSEEESWINTYKDLIVIGLPFGTGEYFKNISKLKQYLSYTPSFAIYSGFTAWTKSKEAFCPSILISHGVNFDAPSAKDTNLCDLKDTVSFCDYVVSVDTNTISWFRSTFPSSLKKANSRMQYVPNYVDLKTYFPKNKEDDKIKIIFPRRCAPERGFWLVADIIGSILEKHKNVEFEFVGFLHSPDIEAKVAKLKKDFPNQISHRLVDADKMFEVYQNADITLIPTLYSEGTSLSCIEAMACANSVVSTNVGGLTNLVIDGHNGLLINPDKDELFCAIEKLINDENLRKTLSKNAYSVAQAFSKENWQKRWNDVIDKIIENETNKTPVCK